MSTTIQYTHEGRARRGRYDLGLDRAACQGGRWQSISMPCGETGEREYGYSHGGTEYRALMDAIYAREGEDARRAPRSMGSEDGTDREPAAYCGRGETTMDASPPTNYTGPRERWAIVVKIADAIDTALAPLGVPPRGTGRELTTPRQAAYHAARHAARHASDVKTLQACHAARLVEDVILGRCAFLERTLWDALQLAGDALGWAGSQKAKYWISVAGGWPRDLE